MVYELKYFLALGLAVLEVLDRFGFFAWRNKSRIAWQAKPGECMSTLFAKNLWIFVYTCVFDKI